MKGTVKWGLGYALLPPLAIDGIPWPLLQPATLEWHSDSPWVVGASFVRAHWDLSWDLLVEGLDRTVGIGDVRIAPLGQMLGGERHQIELRNHEASAVLQVRSASLRSFVAAVKDQWAEWPLTDGQIAAWLAQEAS